MALSKIQKSAIIAQNKAIEKLIESRKFSENPEDYSTDELALLTKYEGYGGTDYSEGGEGLLYEFYTPPIIIELMWRLCCKHGFNGGYVLEPACGTGRFFSSPHRPYATLCTGYETSVWSGRIAQILNPDATIKVKPFDEIFIDENKSTKGDSKKWELAPKFDLVIGNPPYGDFTGLAAGFGERDYTSATNYVEYFISRGLDLLKSGGLLCYIVGGNTSTFLGNQNSTVKDKIAAKSDLIDAYMLPEGLFFNTDVMSQVIVFRKK